MKRILITGANSYIGTSFENYLKQWPNEYHVDIVDMIDGSWRKKSFAGYDTVFHVAGIAHQKETKKNAPLYYKVNRDLAIETAKKAKDDGVTQFVFLSSMSVYGMDTGVITKDTIPQPKSHYGKSKLQAEQALSLFEDDTFKVCILRPPMIYGKGCRGNFQSLVKIARRYSIFPRVSNSRSMLYIDNLSSFVKFVIDQSLRGLFCPHNRNNVSTLDILKVVSKTLDKKLYFSYVIGLFIIPAKLFVPKFKKAFGSLIYQDMECFDYSYCVVDTEESFKKSIA